MEAVDALVEAIKDFKGGLMIVSHDEYFVSRTCTELWVVEEGKASRFRGDFEQYKQHTAAETQKRVEESIKRLNAANS
jgi:ATP-binding cassette subfamily F protein 3